MRTLQELPHDVVDGNLIWKELTDKELEDVFKFLFRDFLYEAKIGLSIDERYNNGGDLLVSNGSLDILTDVNIKHLIKPLLVHYYNIGFQEGTRELATEVTDYLKLAY